MLEIILTIISRFMKSEMGGSGGGGGGLMSMASKFL